MEEGFLGVRISLDERLMPFAADAMQRFAYLHPGVRTKLDGDGLWLISETGPGLDIIQDMHFVLYRAKIYAETRSLRAALVEGVMTR